MRVAAIDCGTNSIRLLVADVVGDDARRPRPPDGVVRLGQGVDRTGEFSAEAIERTLSALRSYAEDIATLGPIACAWWPHRLPATQRTATSSSTA